MATNPAQPFNHVMLERSAVVTGEHAAGTARERTAAIAAQLERWAAFSVFSFPAPGLEAEFQRYLGASISIWTWSYCIQVTIAWLMFAHTLLEFPEQRAALPPHWPLGSLHGIIAASLGVVLLLKPAYFLKHHRTVKLCLICTFMCGPQNSASSVLMWRNHVTRPAAGLSWAQKAKFFAGENIYITAQFLHVLALPVGQIPDLLLNTGAMLASMRGNRGICALPYTGDNLVTMTPALLAITKVASLCLSGVWGLGVGVHPSSGAMSCPVALGFWQVLGWVLDCVLVFVADVQRRRAFLRTHEALGRAHFGLSYAHVASTWPFVRSEILQKVLLVGFLLVLLGGSIAWNLALDFVI